MTARHKKVAEKVCKLCGDNIFNRVRNARYCKKCARRRDDLRSQIRTSFKRNGYVKSFYLIEQAKKYGLVKYIETS